MNIEIGDQGTACRYRGVIKVQIPIPPEQKTLTFNLIAPDGESIAIRQVLTAEGKDAINYHIKHSINGVAFVAFPKNQIMTVFSMKNQVSADAMEDLLKLSIEDQEKFIRHIDDWGNSLNEISSDEDILKRIDDEEKRIEEDQDV